MGWATNGANAATLNSVRVTNVAGTNRYVVLADGQKEQRGALKINWAFGTTPNAPAPTPVPVQRVELGSSYLLRLTEPSATNAVPWPVYGWYRDGKLLGWTSAPQYALLEVGPGSSGVYSVVVSNAVGSSTHVVGRVLARVPLHFAPGEARYRDGRFELQLRGTEGDEVRVEGSTNGVSWEKLSELELNGYERQYLDEEAGTLPQRLYRLKAR